MGRVEPPSSEDLDTYPGNDAPISSTPPSVKSPKSAAPEMPLGRKWCPCSHSRHCLRVWWTPIKVPLAGVMSFRARVKR